jgi:hypothetical protein
VRELDQDPVRGISRGTRRKAEAGGEGVQRESSVGTPLESTKNAAVATARNGAGKSILLATKVFFRVVVDHDDDFFSVDGVARSSRK